ncbi:MAG: flagellar basal body-associated protein FliL [Halorhodospira sp.]
MPKIVYMFMGIMALMMVATMGTVGALALGYITPPGIESEEEPEPEDPQYLKLEPPLTVNFERGQRISYLQAEVEVMARSEEVLEGLEQHMPVVRNNLLMLFSDQSFEELNTRSGREELRQASLEEINEILEEREVGGEVEAVYFTSFVMQ